MMLYLYVQQNIWIVITLLAGVALMLLFCLTYHAMWSPRGEEAKNETIKAKDFASFFAWIRSFVSWVLILIILMSVAFTILTVLAKMSRPPNW